MRYIYRANTVSTFVYRLLFTGFSPHQVQCGDHRRGTRTKCLHRYTHWITLTHCAT